MLPSSLIVVKELSRLTVRYKMRSMLRLFSRTDILVDGFGQRPVRLSTHEAAETERLHTSGVAPTCTWRAVAERPNVFHISTATVAYLHLFHPKRETDLYLWIFFCFLYIFFLLLSCMCSVDVRKQIYFFIFLKVSFWIKSVVPYLKLNIDILFYIGKREEHIHESVQNKLIS